MPRWAASVAATAHSAVDGVWAPRALHRATPSGSRPAKRSAPALSSWTSAQAGQRRRRTRRRAASAPPERGTQTCASGGVAGRRPVACRPGARAPVATPPGRQRPWRGKGPGRAAARRGRGQGAVTSADSRRATARQARTYCDRGERRRDGGCPAARRPARRRLLSRVRRRRLRALRPLPARCRRARRREVGPPPSSAPDPGPARGARCRGDRRRPQRRRLRARPCPPAWSLLPDGSAVVGERDTGRILQVFPDRSPARELMTVPGMDTAGDGGLLGLARLADLSPRTGCSTPTSPPRPTTGSCASRSAGRPTRCSPASRGARCTTAAALLFGADGSLFVGTGDTGEPRAGAADPVSLAGKVLRIDVFGRPVGAGPGVHQRAPRRDARSARGAGRGRLYATDAARDGADELDELDRGQRLRRAGRRRWPRSSRARAGWVAAPSLGAADLPRRAGRRAGARRCRSTSAGRCPATPRSSSAGSTAGCGPSSPTPRARSGSPPRTATASARPAEDDDKVLRILPPSAAGSRRCRPREAVDDVVAGVDRVVRLQLADRVPACHPPARGPARTPRCGDDRHEHSSASGWSANPRATAAAIMAAPRPRPRASGSPIR